MLKDLMRNTVRAGKYFTKALMDYLEPKMTKKSKSLTRHKPTFQPKMEKWIISKSHLQEVAHLTIK